MRRAVIFLVAALLGVATMSVVVPATGGAATPPTVVSHSTTKAKALTTPGLKKIQSIALTPGTWTLVAKATAIDDGSSDFFRCELVESPGTVLDGSTTQLNSGVPSDVITNLAVLTTKTAVTIRHECGHDVDGGDAGEIDAGAHVVGFVTAPSRTRSARTSAQTQLGGGTAVGVENLSLTKGTWVVAAKVPAVVLSADAVDIACTFETDQAERILGTHAGLHQVSTMLQVTATPKLTTTTTISLSCLSDGEGAYLDPGVVLWAWKATSLASATSTTGDACPLTLTGTTANDALVLGQRACNIGVGNYPSQITGVHLRVGTWVALAGYDELEPSQTNVVRCQILNASRGKQVDTASAAVNGVNTGFPSTGVTNLAVVTVKGALDVEGRCGQDNTSGDARTGSGWAFIKP